MSFPKKIIWNKFWIILNFDWEDFTSETSTSILGLALLLSYPLFFPLEFFMVKCMQKNLDLKKSLFTHHGQSLRSV